MIPKLLLMLCSVVTAPAGGGRISGIVVNASDGRSPVGGAEVMLRVRLYGQLVPVARTTADPQGRFVFRDLSVGSQYEYLPGANRQGVHYPGPLVKLTPPQPGAEVELAVRDAVTHPSPLVIRRHEITVRPQAGALHVTESILVANPSSKSYVGQPAHQGGEPVTLQLAVPPDFERLTFEKEFFGRRFSMVGEKLVTGIPWTPGQRELAFTYVLPNSRAHRVWERPLDLPCSALRVSVQTSKPQHVRCNLPLGPVERSGKLSTVRFESDGRTLPAGHVVRLELGKLPLPWTAYGRWLALLVLAVLIAGASYATIGRWRQTGVPSARNRAPTGPSNPTDGGSDGRRTERKRNRSRDRKTASRRAA